MIEGPADHGLHVTYQLHLFVLKSYMPRFHLPRHRYELFFVSPHYCYNLISFVSTQLHISTSFFWNRSPTCRMWAEAVRFDRRLTKITCKPTPFWTRPGLILGTLTSASTRPSWRQSYIAMSCDNNTRVEGLDVILDDPAGLRGQVLINGRMWVHDSSEGEFRLGPLVFQKVQILRAIPKPVNSSENQRSSDVESR